MRRVRRYSSKSEELERLKGGTKLADLRLNTPL
jgi:hypothetical protein